MLEQLKHNHVLDEKTADFYHHIGKLHYEACTQIRLQRNDTDNRNVPLGTPMAGDADISAFDDTIERHARALLQLLTEKNTGQTHDVSLLSAALTSGKLSAGALVGHVCRKDETALMSQAEQLGIAADLLLFVAFTCARAVCETLFRDPGSPQPQLQRATGCPVCGSLPFIARLMRDDGQRRLCCQLCSTEWLYNRLRCAFCGNEKQESLEVLIVEDTPYRIDACRECMHYIKTVDQRAIKDDAYTWAPALEDLSTIHIDLIAGRHDYTKPMLNPASNGSTPR